MLANNERIYLRTKILSLQEETPFCILNYYSLHCGKRRDTEAGDKINTLCTQLNIPPPSQSSDTTTGILLIRRSRFQISKNDILILILKFRR
jgi:hypothetical protein